MVTTSGFTSAPTTRTLLLLLLLTTLLSSLLSLKPYLPLKPTPHLFPYLQLWRLATFQSAYTSSTELLFASSIIYQLRALERIWGSRKFASYVLVAHGLGGLGTVAGGVLLKIGTWGRWGYIPAGPTAVVVSLVAVWRREIPRLGGFKILFDDGAGARAGTAARGIDFSDKWTVYVLCAQLALSQFPFGLLPAAVGWVVGSAWVAEMVPGGLVRFRVPAWVVGEEGGKGTGQRYEGLRRRLEEENQDGMREVSDGVARGEGAAQQRGSAGFLGGMGRYFTSSS